MKRLVKSVFEIDKQNKNYCCFLNIPVVFVQQNKSVEKISPQVITADTTIIKLMVDGYKIYEFKKFKDIEQDIHKHFDKYL